jgi:Spy/CpxP family protein refolding chaperone
MKSIRFGFVFMAIFVFAAFTLPIAFAQMGPGPGGSPHSGPKRGSSFAHEAFSVESFKEKLDLTDEQVEKFSKIRSDYLKESIKKRAEIKVAGVELFELFDQKKIDQAQIEKKLRQIEALKTDIALFRIKMLFKTQAFLNEDQFEKLKTMTKRMIGHRMMKGKRGMMGSGMGQGRMHDMGQGMMGPGMGQGRMHDMGQGMMGPGRMDADEMESPYDDDGN